MKRGILFLLFAVLICHLSMVKAQAENEAIRVQPKDMTVFAGDEAEFYVQVYGEAISYQWQVSKTNGASWSNMNSSTCPSALTQCLYFTARSSHNGYQYRCHIVFADNELYSMPAMLSVKSLDVEPADIGVAEKTTASFCAIGDDTVESYQWQVSKTRGVTWSNMNISTCPSAATSTLAFTARASHTGNQYRCCITYIDGTTLYSKAATLTVYSITVQPQDTVVAVNSAVNLRIEAWGPVSKIQWQVSKTNGATWSNMNVDTCPSAAQAKLSFTAKTAHNGNRYRCLVTFVNGASLYSKEIKLTVHSIKTQPKSIKIIEKTEASFSVVTEAKAKSYQWQVSKTNGDSWSNMNTTTCPSAASPNLSFVAKTVHDGYQYRCFITFEDGVTLISKAATLTVISVPKISTQPNNQTVAVGSTATFKVVASGKNLLYQWQYSKDNGTTWNILSGKVTASLTVKGSTSNNGYMYRCIIKNDAGEVITKTVTLTTQAPASITTQPKSASVKINSSASFSVAANGSGLHYQWQMSKDGGVTWTNLSTSSYPSATTKTLVITVKQSYDGYLFRCVVSNKVSSETSKASKLTAIGIFVTTEPTSGNYYVVNMNSGVYHNPNCYSGSLIRPHNRIWFIGKASELDEMNYRPCSNCNPK